MQMNANQVSCLWNKDWHESTTLHSGRSSDGAGGARIPEARSLWRCWAAGGLSARLMDSQS